MSRRDRARLRQKADGTIAPPKLLVRRQTRLFDRTLVSPLGYRIRVGRCAVGKSRYVYVVSVDGARRDSFETRARALAAARELCKTVGSFDFG